MREREGEVEESDRGWEGEFCRRWKRVEKESAFLFLGCFSREVEESEKNYSVEGL